MVTPGDKRVLRSRTGLRPIYTTDDMDEGSYTTDDMDEDSYTSDDMDEGGYTSDDMDEDSYTTDDMDEDGFDQDKEQVEEKSEEVCPLKDIEKVLDRDFRLNDPDSSQLFVKQYLLKWKESSYLHCSWVDEEELEKAHKAHPQKQLKAKVDKLNARIDDNMLSHDEDELIALPPEWTTVDRILACREEEDGKKYLVKFKELSYDKTYWESESDISAFQNQIQRFKDINSATRRENIIENVGNQVEFKHFDHTPEFLNGSLHEYQLEGLNFLKYSWFQGTNVILADEMGLGKTIQTIAFLATLLEENQAPHLVVAPLSTLRNWEREFSTWTPQLNVVMYTGNSEARRVIREHEFYFPENKKVCKLDVLLTSYEMINSDTTYLKPIKWNCMIVDEGHRLKNMSSKLFSSLTQCKSKHRVLLTGTPLQNNLDELFSLMHFLDAAKFGSLGEFSEEFKDSINQEEKISRLHQMLAPHLLRRLKKDVLKGKLPPKKELILRVDLSSQQKHWYKAVLQRNYQILAKKGGGKISNVLMELRKVCSHPYLLDGAEPKLENADEAFKQLVEASGKLQLLDKLMVKLREQGHRVLIYTQFQHTLDIFEDYCSYKNWSYERIDGKVGGAERQVRIDRFNAEYSNRFCFLLSTRAGAIGINLATADTVIIYDSDWNPHWDIQAMARAHRLGQTAKVLIYRMVHSNSVEEKILKMSKQKMLLERLVVGQFKQSKLSQDELDEIIKYGSKELFSEAGNGKIHYDDAAIQKLLDREYIDAEEGDEEENGFLMAFKVAKFEYIDENEEDSAAAVEEAQAIENNADRTSHWEELLKDKHEMHQAEELNGLGKRKRKCKQQVTYAEEDDDEADDDYEYDDDDDIAGSDDERKEAVEAEPTVVEAAAPQRNPRGRKPYRKRAHGNSEPIPLMEGEGRSLRVLGFKKSDRKTFMDTFLRYGAGNYDWKEFVQPLMPKTYDEIKTYGVYFLKHIVENSDKKSPTFSDGVPKEEMDCEKLLIRMTFMMLLKEKCQYMDDHPTEPLFSDHIIKMFSLDFGKLAEAEHDRKLLRAVSEQGYGHWPIIVELEGLKETLCKQLGISFPCKTWREPEEDSLPESSLNQETGNAGNNKASSAGGTKKKKKPSYTPDYQRLCNHVEQRVNMLEKAIKYEYHEKILAEQAEAKTKVMGTVGASFVAADKDMLEPLPKTTEPIISEETSAVAVDNKQGEGKEEDDIKMDAADNLIIID
ncbi:CHD3-type chromatin-remodeling factor CHR7 isoform X1 [Capsella rubella]|uniref:CHD3-type chromatin-remodeling factor CHR7 isoform X1 n=1 Tax=Capsella rubella TaxID=81985 RepID=UPI000CD54EA3|nr:CHD3-type chromatin-remodeling factor CHR7 isoform X1 [Capsella rubella]